MKSIFNSLLAQVFGLVPKTKRVCNSHSQLQTAKIFGTSPETCANVGRTLRTTMMTMFILLMLAPVMAFAQKFPEVPYSEGETVILEYQGTLTVADFNWQISTNGGTTWNNIEDRINYSGVKSNALTILNTPASFDGYYYRVGTCVGICIDYTYDTNPFILTLTAGSPSIITTEPKDITVAEGESAKFYVEATGVGLEYQWFRAGDSSPMNDGHGFSGTKTATLAIASTEIQMSGWGFYCEISRGRLGVIATTRTAILTVTGGGSPSLPVINDQPKNASVSEGQTATFSISASGADSYQWQVGNGVNWRELRNENGITGALDATLSISGVTLNMNNTQFRCIVSNKSGDVTSNAATLSVTQGTSPILASPESITTTVDGEAVFSVKVDNSQGNVTFQWEVSINKGLSWNQIMNSGIRPRALSYSGETTEVLKISGATADMDGYQYHCIVTTKDGMFISSPATLTVNAPTYTPPVIISQPVSQTVKEGVTATFTVVATGSSLQYQWQLKGWDEEWYDIEEDWDEYTGAQTPTLKVTMKWQDEIQFHCKVSSGDVFTYTNAATLIVQESTLMITSDPVDRTVSEGGSTSFTLGVSYDGQIPLVYKWFILSTISYYYEGTYYEYYNWDEIESDDEIYSGTQTATLSLKDIPNSFDGNLYRCGVDKCYEADYCGISEGGYMSMEATLHVEAVHPGFTQHPSDRTILAGTGTTFTVAAVSNCSSTNFSYQWYRSYMESSGSVPYEMQEELEDGGVYSGTKTPTLTLTNVPLSYNGYKYFCHVYDYCEWTEDSNTALLTVTDQPTDLPAILTHPEDRIITVGDGVSFAVTTAHPDKFTYRYMWQYRSVSDNDFIDIINSGIYSDIRTPTLKLSNVPVSYDGYQYRCRVRAPEANEWMDFSEIANLTVEVANTPPRITTNALPAAVQGRSYSVTLTATGTTPITWSITAGSLPVGLSLDANSGRISGTPTATGQLSLTVKATNSVGDDTKAFTFVVNEQPLVPPVIEITDPAPSEPYCTANDYIAVPFRKLETEHPMKFSLRFSDDAKAAGFKDTQPADLPADMSFKIDVPKRAPTKSYSAVIIISCDGIDAYQDEYPFTFSITDNGIVIVNQPPAFQSLCGAAAIAMEVDIEGAANSYQWYINGQAIAGARSKDYMADLPGTYYVEVMGSCGVIRSSEAVIASAAADPAAMNIRVKWGNVLYVANASDKYTNYQWYHNGSIIPGATDVYITEKDGFLGSYSVQCFKADGGFDEACPVVFDVLSRNGIAVYPTMLRSNDVLNINITADAGINTDATVEIYSMLGIKVYSTRITTSTATIRPDFRQKGNYFVKIILPTGDVTTEKIIVQ